MQELESVFILLGMLFTDPRTAVLIALMAIAAVVDYRIYKIPNWLTLPGAAFGLIYSVITPFSAQHGFLWALGGFTVGLAIMLPMYMMKATGAGDVKLVAMAGAFLGLGPVLQAVVCSFVVGGVAALSFAIYRRAVGRMFINVKDITQNAAFLAFGNMLPNLQLAPGTSVGRLPFGVSIAVGTIGFLLARQLGFL